MFEQIEIILTGIAVIISTLVVILQKMGFIFNGSKKSSHQIKKLETQIEKLKKEIFSDIENETDKAHNTHVKIFEKLEELSTSLAYIKGVLNHKN